MTEPEQIIEYVREKLKEAYLTGFKHGIETGRKYPDCEPNALSGLMESMTDERFRIEKAISERLEK
jgi:hypothetical protein